MNKIVMICRSKDEMPEAFVHLVQALFPECDIQQVYYNSSEKQTSDRQRKHLSSLLPAALSHRLQE